MAGIKQSIDKNNIITTKAYLHGVKILYKQNKVKILEKLFKIVVELSEHKVTTQYHNHPLTNVAPGVYDLHVASDVVLVYRYKDDKLYQNKR